MNHEDCPYYQKRESEVREIREEVAQLREELERDMRALGLRPENLKTRVEMAAILGVKARRLQYEALTTSPYYTETSREGNEKPVSHPIHASASAAAAQYDNYLKQLGLSANAEKVATRAAEKTDEDNPYDAIKSLLDQ